MGQSRVRYDLDSADKGEESADKGAEQSCKPILGQEVPATIYKTVRGRKHTALHSL